MVNELYGISPITSPQDIPLDHAETQPLQVIIQVPDTVNAERCNFGHCRCLCITYAAYRMLYFLYYLVLCVALYHIIYMTNFSRFLIFRFRLTENAMSDLTLEQ